MSDLGGGPWAFRVYIVGGTLAGDRTVRNLRALVEKHLDDGAEIEVMDLGEHPELALEASVLAVPTVERVTPAPPSRVIGDLSDPERAISGLGLPTLSDSD